MGWGEGGNQWTVPSFMSTRSSGASRRGADGVQKLWTAWRQQQRGGRGPKPFFILSNISHPLGGGLRATDHRQPPLRSRALGNSGRTSALPNTDRRFVSTSRLFSAASSPSNLDPRSKSPRSPPSSIKGIYRTHTRSV